MVQQSVEIKATSLVQLEKENGVTESQPRDVASREALHNSVVDGNIDFVRLTEDDTDGIAVFDSDGTYLFVNRRAEDILRIPRSQLLGSTMWEVFPQVAAANKAFRQHFKQAVNGCASTFYESFSFAVSHWLQVRLIPYSISSEIRGVAVYFRDITAPLEVDCLRAESEERFRLMANSTPLLIWTSGTDAKHNWFNEHWLRFTGHTILEEEGDNWAKGIHPDYREHYWKTYRDSFDAQVPFTLEYRLMHHDGEYRWLLENGVPLISEEGIFQGYIGSCVDISEQKIIVERQRRFVRDMLASVTEGRLRLCENLNDLPKPLEPVMEEMELNAAALRGLRQASAAAMEELQFPVDRVYELLTAVGEASMNAVVHGGGGIARICIDPVKRSVQVWIEDHGKGIRDEDLHRATLEKGWSGGNSFGHGFYLMLRSCDRTYLLTNSEGTVVVLEQDITAPKPSWFYGID